jgi:hypothetical protein
VATRASAVAKFKSELQRTGNVFTRTTIHGYVRHVLHWFASCFNKYNDMNGIVYNYRVLEYSQCVLWKEKVSADGTPSTWNSISQIWLAIKWLKVSSDVHVYAFSCVCMDVYRDLSGIVITYATRVVWFV